MSSASSKPEEARSDAQPSEDRMSSSFRGASLALAIAWLLGVTALYLAVRLAPLSLVP